MENKERMKDLCITCQAPMVDVELRKETMAEDVKNINARIVDEHLAYWKAKSQARRNRM